MQQYTTDSVCILGFDLRRLIYTWAIRNHALDVYQLYCPTFRGNKIKTPHASPGFLATNFKTPPSLFDVNYTK